MKVLSVAGAAVIVTGIATVIMQAEVHPITGVPNMKVSTLFVGSSAPVEWEHGWKTGRIIATRYTNEAMGYNIGFKFPKNPADCDRAELSDFMEVHGGWAYQGGGSPGAEMFVRFKDVTDKETANTKLKQILPALSQLITDLGDGKKVEVSGTKELRAAQEQKAKTTTLSLKEQAETLIPVVRAAQPALLGKFTEEHDADVNDWQFNAERFGDFITLRIGRRTSSWGKDGPYYVIGKAVISINLKEAPTITQRAGRLPDLEGRDQFFETSVHYAGDKEWIKIMSFSGVDLGVDGDKKADGWSGVGSVNGYPSGGLNVFVDHLARPAVDDTIVFGAGGGSEWDDRMRGGGSFSYSNQDEAMWKQKRPGATVSVPAGLGDKVHQQIMDAIKAGS